jgi:hypothetical protein
MAVVPLALVGALSLTAAQASAADTCPNAKYRTGPSLFLPECRAYELMTPQGKTNLLTVPGGAATPLMAKATPDGEKLLFFSASGPQSKNGSAGMPTWERATRTAEGWAIEPAVPPLTGPYGESTNSPPTRMIPSSDLSKIFFSASAPYDPAQEFNGNTTLNGGVHVSNGITNSWVSKPTWSGALPLQATPGAQGHKFLPIGGSEDFSTVYFATTFTLTPEDGTSGRGPLESAAVYKWKEGELSNAGFLPDGSLSRGGSTSAHLSGNHPDSAYDANNTEAQRANPVSRDGKSFLFVSPDPYRASQDPSLPQPQLYLARDGKPSLLISAPEGDGEPVGASTGVQPVNYRAPGRGPQTVGYAVATPDHSVVLFSTRDALTESAEAADPAKVKTYRYEPATGTLTYLPDLDRDMPGGTDPKGGPVVELSESGDSMLYRTADGDLRLWRKGDSTLTVSTGVSAATDPAQTYINQARFAAGESVLVLSSFGPLRGDTDHTPGANPTTYRPQIYRYTVSNDHLECISCLPGGTPTAAYLSLWGTANGFWSATFTFGYWSTERVTEDGSTIYFTTETPLVEEDRNPVMDVYQWRDGSLTLITSGATAATRSYLYEVTPSGRDVFILTADRLAPSDTDDLYDIYDARVGGGFDLPHSTEPCRGDGCQGVGAPGPMPPAIASAGIDGLGNSHVGRPGTFTIKAPGRVRGQSAILAVRAPASGRIEVTGPGIKNAGRRVSGAGKVRIRVRLSGAERRRVREGESVRVTMRVSFQPSESGTVREKLVRITFGSSKAKGSRSGSHRKGR